MSDSIWKSTLGEFRDQLAGRDPVPAGVSAAAVSASLGLSLLMKVLEITRKRRDFHGDPGKIEEWLTSARAESAKLERSADEDAVAYAEYMASRKSSGEAAALRRAIEVPLEAARAAATGLRLCAEARGVAPASIEPDLGTAALLLAGAVHGILLSVESNALRLPPGESQDEVKRQMENLKQMAKNHQRW